MPVVRVTWVEGRTPAQEQAVVARITNALCEESGVTPGAVLDPLRGRRSVRLGGQRRLIGG